MSEVSGGPLPLIVIAGPTGSGKSALALAVAEHLGTEILSVDSMQFYRGMEIGTAAASLADRARVPHHFVSFLEPGEEMAAGIYQQMARAEVSRIQSTGRSAVAVGGSGMYLSALIDEIFDGPGRDPEVRARLEEEARTLGNDALLARLRAVDPDYAANLTSVNDRVRIVRALEVYEISGRPYSVLHREHRQHADSLPCRQFALRFENRQDLYDRINRRVLHMIDEGWVAEVQALLSAGHGPHVERLKALGYREIMAHLEGRQSLDAAIAASQMHHRRYAKRQLTWFNADPRIHWLPAGPGIGLEQQLEALLEALVSPATEARGMHRYLQVNAGHR